MKFPKIGNKIGGGGWNKMGGGRWNKMGGKDRRKWRKQEKHGTKWENDGRKWENIFSKVSHNRFLNF